MSGSRVADPAMLAEAARLYLREHFRRHEMGFDDE